MRISQQDVERFANWSGDCNPIHVDSQVAKSSAFGGTIVHGALSTIEALHFMRAQVPLASRIVALDIEFRSEIRPDSDYTVTIQRQDQLSHDNRGAGTSIFSATVLAAARASMVINAEFSSQPLSSLDASCDWGTEAKNSGIRSSFETLQAFDWAPADFRRSEQVYGVHEFGSHEPSAESLLNVCQERVLGLCSFIVGMKAPGLSSLFTRLKVRFAGVDAPSQQLLYRLTFHDYDPHFRVLETELDIASVDGVPIASAQIHSYVRFPSGEPDPGYFVNRTFYRQANTLQGKAALVCGASRGLGAELAAGLGAAKAYVYLACRHPNAQIARLRERIHAAGGTAQVLAGDVGDPEWCRSILAVIKKQHVGLDLLFLNACEPPRSAVLALTGTEQSANYVSRNIGLVQTPLLTFLPAISQSNGTVVAISSSFVDETPPGFADYVAVKMAMEGAIRTAAREHNNARFVIARPPKLQTSWNDTPSGAIGAIPANFAACTILEGVTGTADENLSIVTEFRFDERKVRELNTQRELKLVITASFTLDPITAAFEQWSRELGMGVTADLAPYAQILQQLLNPSSEMARNKEGAVVLLRISDWLREQTHNGHSDHLDVEEWIRTAVQETSDAIKVHRGYAVGPTLLLICPSTPQDALPREAIDTAENQIIQELKDVPGLTVCRANEFHTVYEVPEVQIFDDLREEIAHIPFQDAYYVFLVALILRHFHRYHSPPKKVIVVDCDNTLWKGVVGEVGAAGIVFEPAHLKLQRRLIQLSENGMLLCLCSKNETQDVMSVFESRSDFLLAREHIVAAEINWLPKSRNIHSLAATLNLGLDSFIFLDDNPIECSEVRSGAPNVLTIQWPQDASQANRLLDHLWEFDLRSVTQEDRQRTQMYREEFQRQQIKNQSGNFQQFIDSLELHIDIAPLSDEDLARASQLTLRTNQFNLTTIRRTEAELNALRADPAIELRTVRVRDRFGDYGLVGFMVAKSDTSLEVDTFLLSCRVLGRGVEHRMAVALAELATSKGLTRVLWRYIPTERNTPAKLFLQSIVQDAIADDSATTGEYIIDVETLTAVRFQAAEEANNLEPAASESPTNEPATISSRDNQSPRLREAQIERVTQHFALYRQMHSTGAASVEATHDEHRNVADVVQTVLECFSTALRVPIEKIQRLDRLDAMGCDSLRIVEITVALTRRYPWLPKTLLFEHRSISELVKTIGQLATPNQERLGGSSLGHSLKDSSAASTRDIAIVGMSVHTAAGDSLADLWSCLTRGDSCIVQVPRERNSFVGLLDDTRDHFAGLVEDSANFDSEFFGVSPREAEYMDPQLRLLLQNCWRALDDAGISDDISPAMGIFVGFMYNDYGKFANAIACSSGSVYRCWEGFSLANRISQVLGCHGPSLSIDTACSSSGTALHYACESLLAGDCDTAVVSGVNLIIDPSRLIQLGRLGILSPTGRCVPFGSGADGTVMGEGTVSLVLRPVADAQQRQERIYAVIKGTGISSGAGSVGFTAPNPTAQSMAVRRALQVANVDPRTISYIEAHGTGTELGDPIEVRGLQLAYCDRTLFQTSARIPAECAIGSIKPNIGHLEAGAGLIGVAKVAMQLFFQQLVPSLTSEADNPHVDFSQTPFSVQRKLSDWKRKVMVTGSGLVELPRRAGVNSFGVGGSNVHVILEESSSPQVTQEATQTPDVDRSLHLLALSAPSYSSVNTQVSAWQEYLGHAESNEVANACFSHNVGRKKFDSRTALLIRSAPVTYGRIESVTTFGDDEQSADIETPSIAMLFSGQGSQYPQMLSQLYSESPTYRKAFDECAALLNTYLPQPLQSVVFSGSTGDVAHPIHQTGFTQPALFAVQYSLYRLWHSWGISASYLLGHSIGEIAAYCAAGGCSLADAARMVAARGQLMQSLPSGGSMCSIASSYEVVAGDIAGDPTIGVAALNGPEQTVLSGQQASVRRYANMYVARGIKATVLSVSHAFHSHLMEPMLDQFADVLRKLDLSRPTIPIVSSATGQLLDNEMATESYWLEQARNPVRFTEAMATLNKGAPTHLIEIGPHPVLLGLSKFCLPDAEMRCLPSARRGQPDWDVLLESLGRLFVDGADVNWRGFDGDYSRQRVQVPGYQFEKRRLWIDGLDRLRPSTVSDNSKALRAESLPNSSNSYKLSWIEKRQQPGSTNLHRPGSWLIFSDNQEQLLRFASRLKEAQIICRAVLVELINGSTDSADTTSSSMLTTCTSLDKLHDSIAGAADLQRVLWLSTAEPHDPTDSEVLFQHVVRQEMCLSQIASSVKRCQLPARSIWIITSRAIEVNHEAPQAMASAPLWGWARVAGLELPELWGGIIDVDDLASQTTRLVSEIDYPDKEDQIALRAKQRLVPRLQLCPSKAYQTGALMPRLRNGAVIVTGGLGGIGVHVANWLATNGAKRIVLASRSVNERAHSIVAELRRLGTDVEAIAADVATTFGVNACLQSCNGLPLVGVFHAAGIDRICDIDNCSEDEVIAILESKIKGGWLLHQATLEDKECMFVCFSSIASVWGSSGRSLYAAANAFLDSLAHYRRGRGLSATTLNFGPWRDGGMADQQSLQILERMGNLALAPIQTLEQIGSAIENNITQTVIANIDWDRFLPVIEARRPRLMIAELHNRSQSSASYATSSNDTLAQQTSRNANSAWVMQVTSSTDPAETLRQLVAIEVARILRLPDHNKLSHNRNLFEIGMDSLTSAELTAALDQLTGFKNRGLVLECPTIDSISARLLGPLTQAPDADSKSPAAVDASPSDSVWQQQLLNLTGAAREKRLIEFMSTAAQKLVGNADVAFSSERSLAEIGLDSLGAVEFARQLKVNLGLGYMPKVLGYKDVQTLAQHLLQDVPVSTSSPIVGYHPDREEKLFAFCRRAWPNRNPEWIEPRWRWMYLASAQRLGVEPKVWLFVDGDQIVGHHGAQFINFQIGTEVRSIAWLVETMIQPSHREQGIGAALVIQSREELPFNLSLGQTEQMRGMLEKLGWKRVAPLQTYMLPIDPVRVFQSKLPKAIAPLAAAWMQLRRGALTLRHGRPATATSVREIKSFGLEHDRLWAAVAPDYPCATVRDANYLNWKYVSQPGQNFHRLGVYRENSLIGIVVLAILEAGAKYAYRRANIVEMVTSTKSEHMQATVHAAFTRSSQLGAAALNMHVINPAIENVLETFGFLKRPPSRYLLVSPDPTTDEKLLLDPTQWLVTQGDSDIDRPW